MIEMMQAEYRVTRMQKATLRKSNGIMWLRKLKQEMKKPKREINQKTLPE